MKKVLVLFTHPAFQKSRINKALLSAVSEIDGITIHHLYEEYPDFFIDIKREQKLLKENDIIVWHHPFYWYSAPALLKEWMDLVLEHGYAYGTKGRELEGMWAISIISTGGRKEVYATSGANQFTINQFLAPYKQSANLCRMKYLPPFVVHGSHTISANDLKLQAGMYRSLLIALRDETLNEKDFAKYDYMNPIIEKHV
jgi:glutathione-regulated potassium-efflux system ancillary protein KefG